MAGSVNKVILVGNLGRDPEIRSMPSGGRIANLNLATSETWKDKMTGERKEKTEWHRVVVFNDGLVKVIENYVKKGSKLYIEGQLETRKWTDASGAEKYSTEIVLRPYRGELTLLDGKGGGGMGGGMGGDPGFNDDRDYGAPGGGAGGGGGGFGGGSGKPAARDDFDDDIPF